jgi:hypothetical protein
MRERERAGIRFKRRREIVKKHIEYREQRE